MGVVQFPCSYEGSYSVTSTLPNISLSLHLTLYTVSLCLVLVNHMPSTYSREDVNTDLISVVTQSVNERTTGINIESASCVMFTFNYPNCSLQLALAYGGCMF